MLTLKEFKHIHCIGIGGIGLSAVAELLARRGCVVSGSDRFPMFPLTSCREASKYMKVMMPIISRV